MKLKEHGTNGTAKSVCRLSFVLLRYSVMSVRMLHS